MIQMPESQMGSLRMQPSQLRIEMTDDQQLSTRRRNFMSPTALPLFRELQQQTTRQHLQQPIAPLTMKSMSSQSQITKSLLFNLFLQGFFINYYGYIFWQYSFRYVLLQLWIQDLLTMFILIYFNYRKGEECIWQLIETMFLFFLKVFVVFYYEIQKFKIYFITIMMISLSILVLFMRVVQKLKFQLQNNQQIIFQFIKTLLCVQITLIALKWEERIEWVWSQIFIILWVFLVVFALLLFISFIGCIETIINLLKKQTNQNYLIGNIWIFINIIGYTLLPFTFLYKLTQLYDNQETFGEDETIQLIVLNGIYMLLLTIYTTFFVNNIRTFLKELQGFEQYSIGIPQQPIQIQQELEQRIDNIPDSTETLSKKKRKQPFRFVKLNAPLYLIKMSCTFFAIFDKINFDQNNVKQTEQFSQRALGQESQNRMEFQKEIKANSNSIDYKINNLEIKEQQIENIDELVKENVKSKKILQEQEKSNKSQNSINGDQQSIQDKCLICYENQPNILFIQCRHGGICEKCAENIVLKSNQCYLCRNNIKQILRINTEAGQLVVNEISNIKQNRQIQE
ncbi:unnamed protein product [Paramecium primaurelia]|uniref:RING-type domain-containing protein n=1 Tax=Paramecium primaurelia TaxID=5886 RepID=A0A8S1QJF3_PARPR|nr:unnamed protein product [Paramecium primaurelia]